MGGEGRTIGRQSMIGAMAAALVSGAMGHGAKRQPVPDAISDLVMFRKRAMERSIGQKLRTGSANGMKDKATAKRRARNKVARASRRRNRLMAKGAW